MHAVEVHRVRFAAQRIHVLEVDPKLIAHPRLDQRARDEQPVRTRVRCVRLRLAPMRGVPSIDDRAENRLRRRDLHAHDCVVAVRSHVPDDRHRSDPVVDRAPRGSTLRKGRFVDPKAGESKDAGYRQRPHPCTTVNGEPQLTSTSACIHGWIKHMKYSLVPAGAVTFRSIDSPFLPLPVIPESPGLSTDGAFAWPTPFSRNGNFGGALLLGSAPCALPSFSQIWQLNIWVAVRGASFFATTVNVCGPSSAATLTTWRVPPDGTV